MDTVTQKAQQGTYVDRLFTELFVLTERVDSLEIFLETARYKELDKVEQDDLKEQYVLMKQYHTILRRRLGRAKAKN